MIFDGCGVKKPCCARHFDLLRNAPLLSIYIHFGVALLVLTPLLTSVSLSKNKFFDRLSAVLFAPRFSHISVFINSAPVAIRFSATPALNREERAS